MMKKRVSVHLMVRNGAEVVGRALRSVADFASEVCHVDTGSTDGTPDVVARTCAELGLRSCGVAVSPSSRPDLFFSDVPSSWRRRIDSSLCTGYSLLRDWSVPRNLALDMCAGDYVCKLDADDVSMMGASEVEQVLDRLDADQSVDAVAVPYYVVARQDARSTTSLPREREQPCECERAELYTRFWRNRPDFRFAEVCHENVDHRRRPDASNWLVVRAETGAPRTSYFVDRRDSRGEGVRVPHRNFKVLLREYERLESAGLAPSAHLCMYLAEEALGVLPQLSLDILRDNFRGLGLLAADAAWAQIILGRAHERLQSGRPYVLGSYHEAAELGSWRARLYACLYLAREEPDSPSVWEDELREAVSNCERLYYPEGATFREVAEARRVLAEVRSAR
jgi:glycosyltransferase involved in cell wall biosynthesis